jgi:hypothetical protein
MEDKLRVASRMVDLVKSSPDLEKLLKANPVEGMVAVRAKAEEAEKDYDKVRDRALYRIAITVLSLIALSTAAAAIVFGLEEKTIPEVLVALGSASVGALVGLFAPSPVSKE